MKFVVVSSSWWLCLSLMLLECQGVFFDVAKTQRCFFFDIPLETHIRAVYQSPETTEKKVIKYLVYGPRDANGKQPLPLSEGLTEKEGTISFESKSNGEHWICLRIDTSKYDVPENHMRFKMEISIGAESFDYVDIAKKEHLDELEIQVMKLRDRVRGIQNQQDYAKRKDFQFRDTSESNNSRAMWISVIQILILILSGVIQVRHLQAYFHKKKLV